MIFERAWSRLKAGAATAVGSDLAPPAGAVAAPTARAAPAAASATPRSARPGAALRTQAPDAAHRARSPDAVQREQALDAALRAMSPDAAPRATRPASQPPRQRLTDLLASHGLDAGQASENARIRRLTCFDSLTGLPNRLLFVEQLEVTLRLAHRQSQLVAVLLADVDNFRRIKLSLGHRRSDELVKAVAQRLQQALRESELMVHGSSLDRTGGMARLAGTEFSMVLSPLSGPLDAARVAQRLREAASKALMLDGVEVFPTVSIGIALSTTAVVPAEVLLERADLALGFAREQGRDRTHFYDAAMDATAASRIAIESGLRNALSERQFRLEFQARVDGRTGVTTSREALLRWMHPHRGLLKPEAFIDVAEQSHLIVPIGHWVLEAACKRNRQWQEAGAAAIPVGVNVSAHQVCRPDFVPSVARALELSGLAPEWLELEVTESALLMDISAALRALGAVKELGVRLAIDDFGTGYSSLSYLRDFPFDVLKIDRSFTQRLPGDARTAAITQGIIDLSQRLGMEVVAEGVETQAQCNALLSYGCVLMQGYLFSRPAASQTQRDQARQPAFR
jgi:diguanylate cyclase (GGDEF)-like protein